MGRAGSVQSPSAVRSRPGAAVPVKVGCEVAEDGFENDQRLSCSDIIAGASDSTEGQRIRGDHSSLTITSDRPVDEGASQEVGPGVRDNAAVAGIAVHEGVREAASLIRRREMKRRVAGPVRFGYEEYITMCNKCVGDCTCKLPKVVLEVAKPAARRLANHMPKAPKAAQKGGIRASGPGLKVKRHDVKKRAKPKQIAPPPPPRKPVRSVDKPRREPNQSDRVARSLLRDMPRAPKGACKAKRRSEVWLRLKRPEVKARPKSKKVLPPSPSPKPMPTALDAHGDQVDDACVLQQLVHDPDMGLDSQIYLSSGRLWDVAANMHCSLRPDISARLLDLKQGSVLLSRRSDSRNQPPLCLLATEDPVYAVPELGVSRLSLEGASGEDTVPLNAHQRLRLSCEYERRTSCSIALGEASLTFDLREQDVSHLQQDMCPSFTLLSWVGQDGAFELSVDDGPVVREGVLYVEDLSFDAGALASFKLLQTCMQSETRTPPTVRRSVRKAEQQGGDEVLQMLQESQVRLTYVERSILETAQRLQHAMARAFTDAAGRSEPRSVSQTDAKILGKYRTLQAKKAKQQKQRSEKSPQEGDCCLCGVCSDAEDAEGRSMFIGCELCGLWVHATCYGIPRLPDGPWHCASCEDVMSLDGPSSSIDDSRVTQVLRECALCPFSGLSGRNCAWRQTASGEWVNMECAGWFGLLDVTTGTVPSLRGRLDRVVQLNGGAGYWCCFDTCPHHKHGALLRCAEPGCTFLLHPACSVVAGCEMYPGGQYGDMSWQAFCPDHSDVQRWAQVTHAAKGRLRQFGAALVNHDFDDAWAEEAEREERWRHVGDAGAGKRLQLD